MTRDPGIPSHQACRDEFSNLGDAEARLVHIAERKNELIRRDPLGREFDSLFKQWSLSRKYDETWERLCELRNIIGEKYCCSIYIPEITIQGSACFWFIAVDPRRSVIDARVGGTITINADKSIRSYSFEENGSLYCPSHMIPIIIDPTTLTLNDKKRIKQEVWNIIKNSIAKATGKNGAWNPLAPEGEPQELARVLRLRSETFKSYLNWFDLKMSGLPFRLIAFVIKVSNVKRRDEVFQELIASKHYHRIGNSVIGESNVRHGFNVIYQAIYRQKLPSLESAIETQEVYNCPNHGNNCEGDCLYLKDWLTRFNASHRP
uniref:Uncharacterized protein n=1 Tax=Desulfobacca acetoxidans TaxID=60893 RepID=A0A7V4G9W9_9BACT